MKRRRFLQAAGLSPLVGGGLVSVGCTSSASQIEGAMSLPGSQRDRRQHLVDSTRDLRALIQSDPHRPIYHFVAPEGYSDPFDPSGAIFWKGRYHLGYIYQKRVNGAPQHVWGHAVSADLLHWSIYPDMIEVEPGVGERGIFGGRAFLSKEGVPHVAYYSVGTSSIRAAYSEDHDLKRWTRFSGNPLLSEADPSAFNAWNPYGPNETPYSVFDPEVWFDEHADAYYLISGGMRPGLFKSRDMQDWQFLGPLIDPSNTMRHPFEDISAQDFFRIGDKFMLLFISHPLGAQYYIGSFANDRFVPEKHGRMNWPGGTFFAVEQLRDPSGRNIIWGWVLQPRDHRWVLQSRDQQPERGDPAFGWAGILSLPRVLSLDASDVLQITPAEELRSLRLNEVQEDDVVLRPNSIHTLRASGKSVELQIEMSGPTRSAFGVEVFASPDGREGTTIKYDPQRKELVIDFARSSIGGPVSIPSTLWMPGAEAQAAAEALGLMEVVSEQRAPLTLEAGEPLRLNIFVDRSIIEVFANGRQAMTQVVYPELETSTGVRVFTAEEAAAMTNIRSWEMAQTNAY